MYGMKRKTRMMLSLAVALIFTLTNNATAVIKSTAKDSFKPLNGKYSNTPEEQSNIKDVLDIIIPDNFGSVGERYRGTADKVIVHIQDLHCNFEAQMNFAAILKLLKRSKYQDQLDLVAVEGATGSIDLGPFANVEDRDMKDKIAQYFMRNGYLSGAEYFSLFEKQPVGIYGVENKDLYINNYIHFFKSYTYKTEAMTYVDEVNRALTVLKPLIFGPEMLEISRITSEYEDGSLKFTDYCVFLRDICKKNGVDYRNYKVFVNVLKSIDLDKETDMKMLEKERAEFLKKLQKEMVKEELSELVKQSLFYRIGKISASQFYGYLSRSAEDIKLDMSDYPNLRNYIEMVKLGETINPAEVNAETEKLLAAVKLRIYRNKEEKKLDYLIKNVVIVEKLIDLELNREELAYFNKHRSDMNGPHIVKEINDLALIAGTTIRLDEKVGQFTEHISEMEGFYRIALERDRAIVENTLARIEKEGLKAAIVVTGGFHSEGILEKFKEKGISYVVITPRVSAKHDPSVYLSRMLNKQTPLDKIIRKPSSGLNVIDIWAEQGYEFAVDVDGKRFVFNAGEERKTLVEELNMLHAALNAQKEGKTTVAYGDLIIRMGEALEKAPSADGVEIVLGNTKLLVSSASRASAESVERSSTKIIREKIDQFMKVVNKITDAATFFGSTIEILPSIGFIDLSELIQPFAGVGSMHSLELPTNGLREAILEMQDASSETSDDYNTQVAEVKRSLDKLIVGYSNISPGELKKNNLNVRIGISALIKAGQTELAEKLYKENMVNYYLRTAGEALDNKEYEKAVQLAQEVVSVDSKNDMAAKINEEADNALKEDLYSNMGNEFKKGFQDFVLEKTGASSVVSVGYPEMLKLLMVFNELWMENQNKAALRAINEDGVFSLDYVHRQYLDSSDDVEGEQAEIYEKYGVVAGGDTVNIFNADDGSVVIFQIDSPGHGIHAAKVIRKIIPLIYKEWEKKGPGILNESFFQYIRDIAGSELLLLSAYHINPEGTGEFHRFGSINPLKISAGGESQYAVGGTNFPLTTLLKPDQDAEKGNMTLAPGNNFVIFSDGLTEARRSDKSLYGSNRLVEFVEGQGVSDSPQGLNQALIADIFKWVGTSGSADDIPGAVEDDFSLITLKFRGAEITKAERLIKRKEPESLKKLNVLLRKLCNENKYARAFIILSMLEKENKDLFDMIYRYGKKKAKVLKEYPWAFERDGKEDKSRIALMGMLHGKFEEKLLVQFLAEYDRRRQGPEAEAEKRDFDKRVAVINDYETNVNKLNDRGRIPDRPVKWLIDKLSGLHKLAKVNALVKKGAYVVDFVMAGTAPAGYFGVKDLNDIYLGEYLADNIIDLRTRMINEIVGNMKGKYPNAEFISVDKGYKENIFAVTGVDANTAKIIMADIIKQLTVKMNDYLENSDEIAAKVFRGKVAELRKKNPRFTFPKISVSAGASVAEKDGDIEALARATTASKAAALKSDISTSGEVYTDEEYLRQRRMARNIRNILAKSSATELVEEEGPYADIVPGRSGFLYQKDANVFRKWAKFKQSDKWMRMTEGMSPDIDEVIIRYILMKGAVPSYGELRSAKDFSGVNRELYDYALGKLLFMIDQTNDFIKSWALDENVALNDVERILSAKKDLEEDPSRENVQKALKLLGQEVKNTKVTSHSEFDHRVIGLDGDVVYTIYDVVGMGLMNHQSFERDSQLIEMLILSLEDSRDDPKYRRIFGEKMRLASSLGLLTDDEFNMLSKIPIDKRYDRFKKLVIGKIRMSAGDDITRDIIQANIDKIINEFTIRLDRALALNIINKVTYDRLMKENDIMEVGGDEITIARSREFMNVVDDSDIVEEYGGSSLIKIAGEIQSRAISTVIAMTEREEMRAVNPKEVIKEHLRAKKRLPVGTEIAKKLEEEGRVSGFVEKVDGKWMVRYEIKDEVGNIVPLEINAEAYLELSDDVRRQLASGKGLNDIVQAVNDYIYRSKITSLVDRITMRNGGSEDNVSQGLLGRLQNPESAKKTFAAKAALGGPLADKLIAADNTNEILDYLESVSNKGQTDAREFVDLMLTEPGFTPWDFAAAKVPGMDDVAVDKDAFYALRDVKASENGLAELGDVLDDNILEVLERIDDGDTIEGLIDDLRINSVVEKRLKGKNIEIVLVSQNELDGITEGESDAVSFEDEKGVHIVLPVESLQENSPRAFLQLLVHEYDEMVLGKSHTEAVLAESLLNLIESKPGESPVSDRMWRSIMKLAVRGDISGLKTLSESWDSISTRKKLEDMKASGRLPKDYNIDDVIAQAEAFSQKVSEAAETSLQLYDYFKRIGLKGGDVKLALASNAVLDLLRDGVFAKEGNGTMKIDLKTLTDLDSDIRPVVLDLINKFIKIGLNISFENYFLEETDIQGDVRGFIENVKKERNVVLISAADMGLSKKQGKKVGAKMMEKMREMFAAKGISIQNIRARLSEDTYNDYYDAAVLRDFMNTVIAATDGRLLILDKKTMGILADSGIDTNEGILELLPEIKRDKEFFESIENATKTTAFQA